MKRLDLLRKVREFGGFQVNDLLENVVKYILNSDGRVEEDEDENKIQHVRCFLFKLREKYEKHQRKYERLMEKEKEWLDIEMEIPKMPKKTSSMGRPSKDWEDLGERSKRSKVALLSENHPDSLERAFHRSKKSVQLSGCSLATGKSPTKTEAVKPVRMEPIYALSLKIQCDLSDDQYQMIRNSSLAHNADIFPTLHELFETKKSCYPSEVLYAETQAVCPLQNILDHTLTRIATLEDSRAALEDIQGDQVEGTLYCKIGFDGASSQSVYKQKYDQTDLDEAKKNEESLFQTALVPLKLTVDTKTVWMNKKPSSTHFCRAVNLQYKKETKEVIQQEKRRLQEEVDNLNMLNLDVERFGLACKIRYQVDFTMFDGKAINAITNNTSTQTCNVCKAKPSEMNDIHCIRQKVVSQEALKLGLSTLHCWIRCFEYLLHLGYKMEIRQFYARSPEEKLSVSNKKKYIQDRCREELSLLVDIPKQGFGNTNDGNTARRAFENAEVFSDITGVKVEVITRLRTILKAVCSGYDLLPDKFSVYCQETTDCILSSYSWYVIPPSVHKLLEHGLQVSQTLELPIGMYSEEALEALNKEIRKARLNHSAKISRLNVMKNQFNHLLVRSDPIISSISFVKKRSGSDKALPVEVLSLLKDEATPFY